MNDADLWAAWRLWSAVAGVAGLILALLLIAIWRTAQQIYVDAVRAVTAIQAIRVQSQEAWRLHVTNDACRDIVATLRGIEDTSTSLAEALARGKR